MIIALFPNSKKRNSKHVATTIRDYLVNHGVTVIVEDKDAKALGADPLSSVDPDSIDFLISLGGDGTILGVIHDYPHIDKPILGINLGSLGFMADVPVSEVYPSLQDLLNGAFEIKERIMMEGVATRQNPLLAVNEFSIHRASNPSLIELAIHVDGVYLNTFAADGMIIATPSGSTAYSLAAGGPILTPELEAFVLTPISPHTISNRPIVLMPEQEIQIQYLSNLNPVEISADGIISHQMKTGDVFHLSKSKRTFKIVSLLQHDYFSTLRTKLGWTGKMRT